MQKDYPDSNDISHLYALGEQHLEDLLGEAGRAVYAMSGKFVPYADGAADTPASVGGKARRKPAGLA